MPSLASQFSTVLLHTHTLHALLEKWHRTEWMVLLDIRIEAHALFQSPLPPPSLSLYALHTISLPLSLHLIPVFQTYDDISCRNIHLRRFLIFAYCFNMKELKKKKKRKTNQREKKKKKRRNACVSCVVWVGHLWQL